MRSRYAELLFLLGLLLLCTATTICFALNLHKSEVRCIRKERQALLKFKQGLGPGAGDLLPSWGSQEEDCCNWVGIKCSNRTGHVVKLDLRRGTINSEGSAVLYGQISSSILGLQHLTSLDLSSNGFSTMPEFIGSLTKLQYLNLSNNNFFGTIPPQFGNLSSLISLDLSWNYAVEGRIEDHNLDWLPHLSSLRFLDMSRVNLSKVVNWPDKVNMLPSLLDLLLKNCELSMPVPPVLFNANTSSPLSFLDLSSNNLNSSSIFPWLLKYTNSLVVLDLSFNEIQGSIPKAFGDMVALVDVDLGSNKLEGLIPKSFGNMVGLVHLDLSFNNLEGAIPQTLENLHNLRVLDLSNNSISGEVPDLSKFPLLRELHLSKNRLNGSLTKGMGKLSKLQVLDVSSNSLEGDITEAHLSNLSNLNKLDLSFNSLSLKFSSAWIPPFRLNIIGLSSCKLGPAFPRWLQTQKNFTQLDMSDVEISDSIPNWFWDLSSNIRLLNLSHNQITDTIPLQWFLSGIFYLSKIDLSYNKLSGLLPQLNFSWSVLNLSNNLFQGSITSICGTNGPVDFADESLNYLDLSNNLLSGELPNCWKDMTLTMLNLGNNNFSGRIPDSICSTSGRLQTLHLHNNNFIGELPKALINCNSLKLLDLGENRFSGRIPTWIGTDLSKLKILRLSSNLFMGRMPLQLCNLTSLQILDLSNNRITGTMPKCLNYFTVMAQTQSSDVRILHPHDFSPGFLTFYPDDYIDNLLVTFKEKYLKYSKTLGLVKLIDLSSNKLKGEIPREITSLSGLIGLNLSRNLLTGIIPHNISHMERLESLDLSRNHLSGIIPPSLTTLSFLSYLNLSNNNLSGRIPTGTQLQSFNASTYTGNQDLCGSPLPKRCPGDGVAQGPQIGSKQGESNIQGHANSHEHLWFCATIAVGFIVGFWGVCGSLLLKSSWRHASFRFLDSIGDTLYVTIAISMAKLLRKFKT